MKKKDPLFSVVVSLYNAEKYIKELIDSVLRQTCDDWELILIDDGSTDRSGEICSLYINEKVSYYQIKNSGGMKGRNEGFLRSHGKYIIAADADDVLEPNCLSVLKNAIEQFGCDIIIFGFKTMDKSHRKYNLPLKPYKLYKNERIIQTIVANEYYALWNKAIRGSIVRNNIVDLGILSSNTDLAMIFPYLVDVRQGIVLPDILYNYRVYGESVSHHHTCKKVIDSSFTIAYAESVLIKAGIYSEKLEKLLYRTYAKQLWNMVELLADKKNKIEDFDPIRQHSSYLRFEKYETVRYVGLYKKIFFKLFRKNKKKIIMLLLLFRNMVLQSIRVCKRMIE